MRTSVLQVIECVQSADSETFSFLCMCVHGPWRQSYTLLHHHHRHPSIFSRAPLPMRPCCTRQPPQVCVQCHHIVSCPFRGATTAGSGARPAYNFRLDKTTTAAACKDDGGGRTISDLACRRWRRRRRVAAGRAPCPRGNGSPPPFGIENKGNPANQCRFRKHCCLPAAALLRFFGTQLPAPRSPKSNHA